MASAAIAKDDTPVGDPPMYMHHNSISAQGFLKQCIVTVLGAFLAFLAVSMLKPWDSLRAVTGGFVSGMLEARTFWIFMMGVAVGSIVIPFLMAHLPHFFAESTQSTLQAWCHRGFENIPSSYQFVPVWAEHGVMRGTVFTAPASRWTDSETLHTPWPPPYQGKTAKFLKWSAFVEDGFLMMRQDGKNDVRVSTEGLHCSVPMDARIPLAGAVVDLLPEAYKDKGPWIRKAPLKLIFPGARDPYAEEAVIFFPDTAAEKEQWFLALSWAAKYDEMCALDPEGATTAAGLEAQRLYSQFSRHVRAVAPVMLPTALPPTAAALYATRAAAADSTSRGTSPVGDAGGVRRRMWWGGRRKPRGSGQATTFAAAAAQPPAGQRPKSVYSKSQVVGDFIKDKQWGSQPMKQGLKGENVPARVKGALSVSKKRSSSAQNLLALAPAVAPIAQVIQPEPAECPSPRAQRPAHSSASTSDLATAAVGPGMKAGLEHTASGPDISHCLEPAAATGRLGKGRSSRHGSAGGLSTEDPSASSAQGSSLPEGAPASAVDGGALLPELFAGHGPAQLAGLHAINMFLVRYAFDLLRSRRFHSVVQRRVQLRLTNITVPNFIAPLQLAGLDLGNTMPLVKSAHALPSPSKVLMPRLVMHIVYQGTCTLTIKTSINMKESAAAMAMDKTAEDLDRGLDGGSSTTGAAASAAGEAGADTGASAELAGPDVDGAAQADSVCAEADGADGPDAGSGAVADGQGKSSMGTRSGRLAMLGYRSIKSIMTGGVKRVMDSIAESVSGTNVTLEVSITELDGPVMVWMAPPPSNIMWLSFLEPPKLKVTAKPLNVNAMVHYTAMAVKLTAWLERKIKQALQKNMVFPACTDIKMGFLMDHNDLATDNLLGLHIPPQHASKHDNLQKSNKDEKSKDGPWEKHHDRSKSVTASFGASSVCAPVEHASGSAPAALPYTDDVEAAIEQGEASLRQAAEPPLTRPESTCTSTDQTPDPAEIPPPERSDSLARGQVSGAGHSRRRTRFGSDASLPSGDPGDSSTPGAPRRPFLRVFTQGIPRILRRGPQPASPLQPAAPAPAAQQESVTAVQATPLQPGAQATFATPLRGVTSHAEMPPAESHADVTASDIISTVAQEESGRLHPAAAATQPADAAPPHVHPDPSETALVRPDSCADLMELSPQVDIDAVVHREEAGVPAEAAAFCSDPCMPSAASELGLSDAEVVGGPSPAVSPAGLPGLQSQESSTEEPQPPRVPGDAAGSADCVPDGDNTVLGDVSAVHTIRPAAAGGSAHATLPVVQQSSTPSRASSPDVAAEQLQSPAAEVLQGIAARTGVSGADVSDGAAALSDAHNSNSAATPDSSADEGALVDGADPASPAAAPHSPWPQPSSQDGLTAGSPAAASVASAASAPGSIASGAACDPAPPAPAQCGGAQARSAGVALGESARKGIQRGGDCEGEEDTTTSCSDDVRSVMSTVGAPSDVETPVGSTSGAARASPCLPDMMHQDPTQAALLHLHMLGKSKSIKKGSYIISTDGAVVRAKKRLS